MYPLKFENIYFEKIWGGRDLHFFRDNLPNGNIGESWDVACHETGTSVISNGIGKGMRLDDIIKLKGHDIVGTSVSTDSFPLLVKLINAKDNLSVQVHPDDDYAKKFENQFGKTEAWYVLSASDDAHLVLGTKDCSKEEFEKALRSGDLDKYLNKVPVKQGDAFFIKSGLLHAIGSGVVLAEIQQSSDVTYRVFDYNRGRETHVEKALDVVDLSLEAEKPNGVEEVFDGYSKMMLFSSDKFTMEIIDVKNKFIDKSNPEKFYILTCVEGEGTILSLNSEYEINTGDSLLIPALLGEYEVNGNLKFIKSYV